MNKFDCEKFEEKLREMGIEYDPKAFKAGRLTKLLLKLDPIRGTKRFNKRSGVRNDVFDKAHELFSKIERIDIFPLGGGLRGFVLVLDQNTALFFYQDGDYFKYDGFEMGKYAKGKVTIFDDLPDNLPSPYDL
ncbi:MAG: hypothetical protein HYW51_02135 [Candidatus Doudnabacteria bacterium]|nr:hypothetical protein [Candidatus Doudnabacteria bacterium]